METDFYPEYFELESWHWWFIGRRRILGSVLDNCLPTPGAEERRLLDVGCGTGTMLQHLARYGAVRGLDADAQAVSFCRERGLDGVELLTSTSLPFADSSFDVVTILDVLEHLDDDAGMLREIGRVLRPEGTLLLSVPAYHFLWGPQDEISHHKRRYTAGEIRARVAEAGFEARRISYFNTLLFLPIAALRLLRPNRRPSDELRSDFSLTSRGPVNWLLSRIFAGEAMLLTRVDLPFGVSILGLCSNAKPGVGHLGS